MAAITAQGHGYLITVKVNQPTLHCAVKTMSARAARVFEEMRASSPLPGHEPVRLPGEGKSAAAALRRENGLNLNPTLRRDLAALAQEYGIEAPFGPAPVS